MCLSRYTEKNGLGSVWLLVPCFREYLVEVFVKSFLIAINSDPVRAIRVGIEVRPSRNPILLEFETSRQVVIGEFDPHSAPLAGAEVGLEEAGGGEGVVETRAIRFLLFVPGPAALSQGIEYFAIEEGFCFFPREMEGAGYIDRKNRVIGQLAGEEGARGCGIQHDVTLCPGFIRIISEPPAHGVNGLQCPGRLGIAGGEQGRVCRGADRQERDFVGILADDGFHQAEGIRRPARSPFRRTIKDDILVDVVTPPVAIG